MFKNLKVQREFFEFFQKLIIECSTSETHLTFKNFKEKYNIYR